MLSKLKRRNLLCQSNSNLFNTLLEVMRHSKPSKSLKRQNIVLLWFFLCLACQPVRLRLQQRSDPNHDMINMDISETFQEF